MNLRCALSGKYSKFPDLSNSTKVQKGSPLSVRVTPLLARIATPRLTDTGFVIR